MICPHCWNGIRENVHDKLEPCEECGGYGTVYCCEGASDFVTANYKTIQSGKWPFTEMGVIYHKVRNNGRS